MKKIIFVIIAVPGILLSQTHSIDNMNLEMAGTTSFNNISSNTYYNTNDSCDISWSVVDTYMPAAWEFSFCFPNCYSNGQAIGQDNFIPNEQIYLGCHFYPNGIAGVGTIKLEIITNGVYKDTVTWNGTISSITSTDEKNTSNNAEIQKIFDVFGRSLNSVQKNQPLLYLYDDGTVEKRIIIKE
jgi:hypothetical protein